MSPRKQRRVVASLAEAGPGSARSTGGAFRRTAGVTSRLIHDCDWTPKRAKLHFVLSPEDEIGIISPSVPAP